MPFQAGHPAGGAPLYSLALNPQALAAVSNPANMQPVTTASAVMAQTNIAVHAAAAQAARFNLAAAAAQPFYQFAPPGVPGLPTGLLYQPPPQLQPPAAVAVNPAVSATFNLQQAVHAMGLQHAPPPEAARNHSQPPPVQPNIHHATSQERLMKAYQ